MWSESAGKLHGSTHKVGASCDLARRRGPHQVKGGAQEEPVKKDGSSCGEDGGDCECGEVQHGDHGVPPGRAWMDMAQRMPLL
jgi:hypothetical protein